MSTYSIRKKLIDIARQDVGKVEVSKNQAPWIAKLWPATDYPDGMENREPYCAAGQAYCLMRWLSQEDVLAAFSFTPEQAEKWRCKSARAFGWLEWAEEKHLHILPRNCILHAGDLAVYEFSHIEMVTDDDNTTDGPFIGLGYNTNSAGSRDGEGCFEKPRSRSRVRHFIRMLD